ncbi:S1 family peptidase [Streptomyces sp. TRM66268-LWL]|uniref:S1 family peptidase n=1 Tax=Streptomyces polyasparticus TaxID=2767826 RepID=A0ABR7S9M0_9ACTN|nr:S1 family peptidase [Streptomyces polyasparticus]MBC9711579.1 S1 family peptidase [Streptomyces polyasparticus]
MKRTLALAAALAAFPLTLGSAAVAAPEPTPTAAVTADAETYRLSSTLKSELGARSAGSYLDADGELVTTVTSEADAALVRAEGARPELVTRSGAELRSAQQAVLDKASVAGTSVGIDPRRNQVVVEADSTVSKAELRRLQRAADAQDGAVRVVRIAGVFKEEVAGGDAIYGGGYRCSAAFNVSSGSTRYFLTAGHCTNAATEWRATSGGPVIGQRHGTSYPTNDYGIVRYTDGSAPAGNVNLYNGSYRDITSAADPVVGQAVSKSGSTTKVTSGTVTATNVTVNYGSGNIAYGMVRTTVCSAGGDSGGAHFSGSTALGIHSGSGGCSDGVNGSAIFQPVREALTAYGVNVY